MRRRRIVALAAVATLVLGLGTVLVIGSGHGSPRPGPRQAHQEPEVTRVYVDNTGPLVSVTVRTPREPWHDSLTGDIGGRRFRFERGAGTTVDSCSPRLTAPRDSLLTRIDLPRRCLPEDGAHVRATVTLDGAEAVEAQAERSARPNVLMIMVDDMRADDLRWMPNVQRLIGDQGVTFENGFAPYPLCCPARSSVLTGQYTHNHGVWTHNPPFGFPSLDDSSTFATWLQEGGYRTTYLGKYLNGYGTRPARVDRRTDHSPRGRSTQYVPPGWSQWRGSIDGGLPRDDPRRGSTYNYYRTTLNDDGHGFVSLRGEYQTDAYARLASGTLRDNARQQRPWLSYVSFTAPHRGGPHEADDPDGLPTPAVPPRVRGRYDDLIQAAPGADWHDPDPGDKPLQTSRPISDGMRRQMVEVARQRAESLHVVDEAVARILRTLDRTGEAENTLVLFTSDNGYFLGEQNRPTGKIWPYEPSLRVPLLVRGPGVPLGEHREDPFTSIDFAPTFADLADVRPATSVDGVSMLDEIRLGDNDTDGRWRRTVLTETFPNPPTRRAWFRRSPAYQRAHPLYGKVTGLRTPRYLYTEWVLRSGHSGVRRELYDLEADPDEYHNLAEDPDHAELVARLHRVLHRARTCRADGCRRPLPPALLR